MPTYILAIETTTRNCSIALFNQAELLSCKEIASDDFSHAEKLHLFIADVLQESQIKLNQLHAVAVSSGPGSYTGLRIGVSAAKGLAYALHIPLLSVDTLTALASLVPFSDGLVIPILDARRMEVYSAIFDENKVKIRETQAQILDESSFAEIEQKIYFIGDAVAKAKAVLQRSNYIFMDDIIFPTARAMGSLGYQKFMQSDFEDVAYYEPFYLKDFLVLQKKQK